MEGDEECSDVTTGRDSNDADESGRCGHDDAAERRDERQELSASSRLGGENALKVDLKHTQNMSVW